MAAAASLQVSNIQTKAILNANHQKTGENVVYERRNTDGTTDLVERVWRIYPKEKWGQPSLLNILGLGGAGITPKPVAASGADSLKQYILNSERTVGNRQLANANVDQCGSLVKAERIPSLPTEQELRQIEISNIQTRSFTGANHCATRENVIYHRKNPDGTSDKVERTWQIYGSSDWGGNSIASIGYRPAGVWVVDAGKDIIPALKGYIMCCEKSVGKRKAADVGGSGLLLKEERLEAPLQSSVQTMNADVAQLRQRVAELAQANTTLSTQNQQLQRELDQVKRTQGRIIGLLEKSA